MADLQNSTIEARAPTAQVLPFKRPPRRSEDGVLYVPPPTREGTIYLVFSHPRPGARKKRWMTMTEFCNGTIDVEETMAADWRTAMFVARCQAAKYGFRVIDVVGPQQ